MAAGKPIVSTPITDVAEPYGDMVALADSPESFVAACERALLESDPERISRLEQFRDVLTYLAHPEPVRWAELARSAASIAGLDAARIMDCSTIQLGGNARQPT